MNEQYINQQQPEMNNQQSDNRYNPMEGYHNNMNSQYNEINRQRANIDDTDEMLRAQNDVMGSRNALMDNNPVDMGGQSKYNSQHHDTNLHNMANQHDGNNQYGMNGQYVNPNNSQQGIMNSQPINSSNSQQGMMNTQPINPNNSQQGMMNTQPFNPNNHHDIMNTQHTNHNEYRDTIQTQHPSSDNYHDALNFQPDVSSNHHDINNTHHTSKIPGEEYPSSMENTNRFDNSKQQSTSNRGVGTNMTDNNLSGSHPATTNDINGTSHLTPTSNPNSGQYKNNTNLSSKDGISTVSSNISEYGSSDGNNTPRNHDTKHSSLSADENAFIKPNEMEKHWQNHMTPAERAKELAKEMRNNTQDHTRGVDGHDKSLKIGRSKEVKLD